MSQPQRTVSLHHAASGRDVPVEVTTVFGRSSTYYRYGDGDERADRLLPDVVEDLAILNYIQISEDDGVSRTHGVFDPRVPGIRDLNSTNGTKINGHTVPTRQGRAGPVVAVRDSDTLRIGKQEFTVKVRTAQHTDLVRLVQSQRHVVILASPHHDSYAQRLESFLKGRKGFETQRATDGESLRPCLERLKLVADPHGITAMVVHAEAHGEELRIGQTGLDAHELMKALAQVPGRKIFGLELQGDPAAIERVFRDHAYEDMMLVSAPVPVDLDSQRLHMSVGTDLMKQLRDGVSGTGPAIDDLLDGLDALIQPSSNILDARWTDSYQGRVHAIFGERERPLDEELSHSLRLGSTTFRF